MGIAFQLKGGLSPRMYVQAQLGLKGIKGSGPFHFVSVEGIGTSSEGLNPAALFVSRKEIMAETFCVQVGCGSGCSPWPLTDESVYFCTFLIKHTH